MLNISNFIREMNADKNLDVNKDYHRENVGKLVESSNYMLDGAFDFVFSETRNPRIVDIQVYRGKENYPAKLLFNSDHIELKVFSQKGNKEIDSKIY